MISIIGFYYDGKTAAQFEVTVCFYESGNIEIQANEFSIYYVMSQAKISPRIGNTCRNIYLNDGAKLEFFSNDEIDIVAQYFKKNKYQSIVHQLEKNWHYALLALFSTLLLITSGIEFGVPLLAKKTAYAIPYHVAKKIGLESLSSLDSLLLEPSQLTAQKQQHLHEVFNRFFSDLPHYSNYQLNFRSSSQIGANALAFPGGVLIMTDGLVNMANDEEIVAVLAHEIGHVEFQHGLRSLFQNSFSALLIAGLLGDVSSISSLAVTLPTILVQTRYSRQFESEADDYALHFLKRKQINPLVFAKILAKLQPIQNQKPSEFDYLSSHPNTQERIDKIKNGGI